MNALIKRIVDRVNKAKAENKRGSITVRVDTVKKIIEQKLYTSLQCDYSYTDDYAWDAASNYGKGELSHEGSLNVAERHLDRTGTRCYISQDEPNRIHISPYSNLSYSLFIDIEVKEEKKATKKIVKTAEVKTNTNDNITCEMNLNNELNGVELKFSGIPSETVRATLKANSFRWSKYKKVWFSKQTEETILFAESLVSIYNDAVEEVEQVETMEVIEEVAASQEVEEVATIEKVEVTEQNENTSLIGRKIFGQWGVMSGWDYGYITGSTKEEVIITWEEDGHKETVYTKDLIVVNEDTNMNPVGLYLMPIETPEQPEEQPTAEQKEVTPEGKQQVKNITFLWSESSMIPDNTTVTTFEEAEKLIKKAASEAPKDGCYDKTKFMITWEDGQEYTGRIDIVHSDLFKAQPLKQHIESHCNYVINDREGWHSEEDKASYREFLDTYLLEDYKPIETAENVYNSTETPKGKVIDFTSRFQQKKEHEESNELYNKFLNNILPYMTKEDILQMQEVYKTNDNEVIEAFFNKVSLKAAVMAAQKELNGNNQKLK